MAESEAEARVREWEKGFIIHFHERFGMLLPRELLFSIREYLKAHILSGEDLDFWLINIFMQGLAPSLKGKTNFARLFEHFCQTHDYVVALQKGHAPDLNDLPLIKQTLETQSYQGRPFAFNNLNAFWAATLVRKFAFSEIELLTW